MSAVESNEQVTVCESNSYRATRACRIAEANGYDIVDFDGIRGNGHGMCLDAKGNPVIEDSALGFGFLGQKQFPDLKYFFGLLTEKGRRHFVGMMWIDLGRLGANHKNWVLEVYGREYLEPMVALAKTIAEELKSLKIHVRLATDEPKTEEFPGGSD